MLLISSLLLLHFSSTALTLSVCSQVRKGSTGGPGSYLSGSTEMGRYMVGAQTRVRVRVNLTLTEEWNLCVCQATDDL